ncbi:MAG: hypothetical protein QOI48_3917 [Solirubrobacteraceae bacterium]|nr:hypothetical protein [Solirubrobacteraceae bacterium]
MTVAPPGLQRRHVLKRKLPRALQRTRTSGAIAPEAAFVGCGWAPRIPGSGRAATRKRPRGRGAARTWIERSGASARCGLTPTWLLRGVVGFPAAAVFDDQILAELRELLGHASLATASIRVWCTDLSRRVRLRFVASFRRALRIFSGSHANYITPQAVHVLTGRWGVLLHIVYRLTPGTPTKTSELYALVIIVVGILAAAAIRAADSHGTPQFIPRRARLCL